MNRTPVCVFAKAPVSGRVKTRLAHSIGDAGAAALASAMLQDTWATVCAVDEAIPILAAAEQGDFPIEVSQHNFWLQGDGELGFRIENILRRALVDWPGAIALGADSPLLTKDHLQEAIRELQHSDAVIGPACDGGFYLLGVRRCPAGLLRDLPWSCVETCRKTAAQLRSNGMEVSQLSTLADVDELPDLERLYGELRGAGPDVAPATRQWFAECEPLWSASSYRL